MTKETALEFLVKRENIGFLHPLTNMSLLAEIMVDFVKYCTQLENNKPPTQPFLEGVTLRDQFAMTVVDGVIANYVWSDDESIGTIAYQLADIMLKAREVKADESELPHLYKKGGEG